MNDQDRIAAKAHEIWEAEGRPHGRNQEHWDQAKEIVALQDSASDALLPRTFGADTPVEEKSIAIDNEGEVPVLTDTGEHDLTSIDREPAVTKPHKTAAKSSSRKGDSVKTSAPAKKAAPRRKGGPRA